MTTVRSSARPAFEISNPCSSLSLQHNRMRWVVAQPCTEIEKEQVSKLKLQPSLFSMHEARHLPPHTHNCVFPAKSDYPHFSLLSPLSVRCPHSHSAFKTAISRFITFTLPTTLSATPAANAVLLSPRKFWPPYLPPRTTFLFLPPLGHSRVHFSIFIKLHLFSARCTCPRYTCDR